MSCSSSSSDEKSAYPPLTPLSNRQHEDVGSGIPVVLIHGHPFDRTMWKPQVQRLQGSYRLICPDLRGYGSNTAVNPILHFEQFSDDVLELASSLKLGRFVLGGLSMGGQIAFECYRKFPEKISALILADTSAQLDSANVKQLRFDTADRLEREGMHNYSREQLPRMLVPEHILKKPAAAQHVLRMMEQTSPGGAAAALRARANRVDYSELLSTITVPTLIIVGDKDEYTPINQAEFMHTRIPGSQLKIIQDAGHMPNLEQPDAFNACIEAFLRTSQIAI
ncbi:MAG: hydrolase [Acidobacteriales bacterium]|nr:hydrolase [Terriglobales bacterium]